MRVGVCPRDRRDKNQGADFRVGRRAVLEGGLDAGGDDENHQDSDEMPPQQRQRPEQAPEQRPILSSGQSSLSSGQSSCMLLNPLTGAPARELRDERYKSG